MRPVSPILTGSASVSAQEAEDIWDAALSAGAAGREECFLRGFRLGALLMLDLLSGGEGERGTKTRSRPL